MKAFLLAAGLGTRLKPFTDHHPKALASVNGLTLLERAIRTLQKYEVHEFVINIHHFGHQIKDFLEENKGFGSRFYISDESEQLLETGGALLHARPFFEKTAHILMINVDILSNIDLRQFIHYHLVHDSLATLAVQNRDSSRQLLFEKNNQDEAILKAWINKKTQEFKPAHIQDVNLNWEALSFSGIQLLRSEILDLIRQSGKFSIIDAYLDLMQDQKIIGYDHTGDLLIDAGKPENIQKAEKYF